MRTVLRTDNQYRAMHELAFRAAPRRLSFERGDYFHGDPFIWRIDEEDGIYSVVGHHPSELSELSHG